MKTLIEKVPRAMEYCKQVVENIEKYKMFPEEEFEQIISGVLSTTEEDTQGDKMAKEALYSMAKSIKENIVWQRVEHNPLIQPIGRTIAAEVFPIPKSNEYFLAGILGIYSMANIPRFCDFGVDLKKDFQEENIDFKIDFSKPQAKLSINPINFDKKTIDEMLSTKPNLVENEIILEVRKAAEPIEIVKIFVAIYLLMQNPFSKKFLEVFGEEAAKSVISFLGWVKEKVVKKVHEVRKKKKTLFEFQSKYKNCNVEFVIDETEDIIKYIKAIDSISFAARSAIYLIDQLEKYEPQLLIYEFDMKNEDWNPIHAATKKRGIISDKPKLIALEKYKGLSPGGIVKVRDYE